MSGILDKYDEASSLAYNYTYRMLMCLKNIIENYERLEKRGCLRDIRTTSFTYLKPKLIHAILHIITYFI